MEERLKCRFCDYSTVKAYKTKEGKFRGVNYAHDRLLSHVERKHPEEHARIMNLLGEEEGSDGSEGRV